MTTTIKVSGIKEAISTRGKTYWKIDTNQGIMSCFEKDVVDGLAKSGGKECVVEIKESNGFKNIRSLIGEEIINITPQKESNDKFAEAREEKNKTMYVSYAKDIFLNIKDKYNGNEEMGMKKAIEIVKQAINAF